MAWNGYWRLGESEIINGPRVEAYAAEAGAYWFRPYFNRPEMPTFLGETEPYRDPVTDEAPWMDPDRPESGDFFGVYPLDVSGVGNSSRTAPIVEFTVDGGTPGRVRHGTQTVVFSVLLVGKSDRAVDFGLNWLRRAVSDCAPTPRGVSNSEDLYYFAAEPIPPGDPEVLAYDAALPLQRMLRKVVVTSGPTVVSRRVVARGAGRCAGALAVVNFTAVAGLPFEFTPRRALLQGYLSPGVADPWAPNAPVGIIDASPTTVAETPCEQVIWEPVFDPLCPALVNPPGPVTPPLACFTLPANWSRRRVQIVDEVIPEFEVGLPIITLRPPPGATRTVSINTLVGAGMVTFVEGVITSADIGSVIESPNLREGTVIVGMYSPTIAAVSNYAIGSGATSAIVSESSSEMRNIRLRFYPDVDGTADPDDDPCGFVSDLLITYLPLGSVMTIDASLGTVRVVDYMGRERRADSLVVTTDGRPVDWPTLSCQNGWVMTVDTEVGVTPPVIGLSMLTRGY